MIEPRNAMSVEADALGKAEGNTFSAEVGLAEPQVR